MSEPNPGRPGHWPARVSGWLRLGAAVALLALAALVVFPAPTYRTWMLSLGLAEFGHWLAPVSLLLLWPGWHRTVQGMAAAVCGAIAAACFLTPLVRALPVAKELPGRLDHAFGVAPHADPDAQARARPLDPVTLFTGMASPAVTVTEPGPPAAPGLAPPGAIDHVHPEACSTVNVCPAIVIVPEPESTPAKLPAPTRR